jgi:hypothetical protein
MDDATRRHWEQVADRCFDRAYRTVLLDAPWLSDDAIAQALTRRDRRELDALVKPDRQRKEAEARAMANLPQVRYLEALEEACLKRLPVQTAKEAVGPATDNGKPLNPIQPLGDRQPQDLLTRPRR